uniref:UDP-N-acetylglucosamine 4-epimerase n=1 Tax=Setaria digitata TaxID=48799 RepID=A0A915PTC9_9BILA
MPTKSVSEGQLNNTESYVAFFALSAMTVVITGAAGFIGSHVVLELLEAGYDVICVDNFSNSLQDINGSAVSLKRVSQIINKDVPFVFADCRDEEQLETVFKKYLINGVVHLASLKAVGESVKKPLDYYNNNLVATLVLLKLCEKYNVKSFVFSSSATVYGLPRSLPIKETDPVGFGITNPYGHTKHMIEQILMDLASADKKWNIIILRYFNPVGAHPSGLIGEDPKGIPNNLMPYMSQVAIGKLPVLCIFGTEFDTPDGTGIRDYIHVVDLARGHVAALNYLNKQQNFGCEVYNLGTGKGYSVLEMVAALEKASGRQIKTEKSLPRPGDVACIYCDPLLAIKKLGWKCEYGLEEMCFHLWNWQVKNPNGQDLISIKIRKVIEKGEPAHNDWLAASKSLNVGVLGHVDCGKTTLARALSTVGSTAAFDRHAKVPNLRANTIDLGYSTLTIDDAIIALVDCPGHASLIRSVLAASSVFDMAIVVVNSVKGVEQQTAEHLLLVSLLCPDHVIIVINKIDLIDEKTLAQMTRRCRKVASNLNINSELQIVPVSLTLHKEKAVVAITNALRSALYTPQRLSSGHFVMFVDHCFPVKGKGTVMTGTVVDGMCSVGMDVEIGALQEKRKIKSMQRWKEDVRNAEMGDRAALLFHNISAKDINRTVIFEPGTLRCVKFLLVSVNRIVYFTGVLYQGSKLHISTGFDTVIGQCHFLAPALPGESDQYEIREELEDTVKFAILNLERFIYTKENSFFIASKLDHQGKGCRFVFHGRFLKLLDGNKQICRFRRKKKVGKIERIENERSVICSGLFKKETNIGIYCNMNVYLSTGEVGRLESAFGKNGKVRISFQEELSESTKNACSNGSEVQVTLYIKKFLDSGKIECCSPCSTI